jgi:transposase
MIDFITSLIRCKDDKKKTTKFRLETAPLVVDQGYTHPDAAKAMVVGYFTLSK